MLNHQLIHLSFPYLRGNDTVAKALQLMDDFEVSQLPLVAADKYAGLINKNDLLDYPTNTIIDALTDFIIKVAVPQDGFFVDSLKCFVQQDLSILPVIDDKQALKGCITNKGMLEFLSHFLSVEEPGGIIVLEMEQKAYSFGEVCKLVETNDAMIMQLNTKFIAETGQIEVCIKLNKRELSDVVATFQRYDYEVKYYSGDERFPNEIRENYQHLMAYLSI